MLVIPPACLLAFRLFTYLWLNKTKIKHSSPSPLLVQLNRSGRDVPDVHLVVASEKAQILVPKPLLPDDLCVVGSFWCVLWLCWIQAPSQLKISGTSNIKNETLTATVAPGQSSEALKLRSLMQFSDDFVDFAQKRTVCKKTTLLFNEEHFVLAQQDSTRDSSVLCQEKLSQTRKMSIISLMYFFLTEPSLHLVHEILHNF